LLPDGSVVVAGGVDPTFSEFTGLAQDPLTLAPKDIPLNQKKMEIYKPPYFFKGARPTITAVSNVAQTMSLLELDYGDSFVIETPQAASIVHVIFMKLGAMTHHTDTEQRSVDITFVHNGGGILECDAPNDPKVMPPGDYMIWILDGSDRPCEEASMIKVRPKLSEEGATQGSLEFETDDGTEVVTNYNGTDYKVVSVYGKPVDLFVNNKMVHLDYHGTSDSWGSHHLTYGRFKTIQEFAEFLIDNGIEPMDMA
jgi:hypothetical protein